MKKGLNVIQIKGMRGMLLAGFVVCCLATGFIMFPAWLAMHIWNFLAGHVEQMPAIGIFQGILLWGIIAASYFTFRRDKVVVCMNAPEGLSEEELKNVFSDIRRQAQADAIISTMMKAREAELRIKNLSETNIPKIEASQPDEKQEHVETK